VPNDCSYCQSPPRGIEGHDALFIVDIRSAPNYHTGTPVFRCSVCGSLWMREYSGGGSFDWRRLRPAAGAKRET
jgi:hypothetical protein